MVTHFKLNVAAEETRQRLDSFLAAHVESLTRSRIKALIEAGHVRVDGAPAEAPARRLKSGQSVRIEVPDPVEPTARGQDIPLDVVYEDDDLIVIDKPAGLVVHPAPGNPDRTLVNALIAHCGAYLSGIGGVRRPGIVHRLDKDTSGLMVAAKTDVAHQSLVGQFAGRTVTRSYQALVWGRPARARDTVEGAIGRSPRNRKKMAVVTTGGKPARTGYVVEKSFAGGQVSLLTLRLGTGRTHQIRVHMAAIGHPVLCDPLYSGRRRIRVEAASSGAPATLAQAISAFQRQALHARELGFEHPSRPEKLHFERDFPSDIKELILKLSNM